MSWLLSQPWAMTTVGTRGLKLELVMEPALFMTNVCAEEGLRLKKEFLIGYVYFTATTQCSTARYFLSDQQAYENKLTHINP